MRPIEHLRLRCFEVFSDRTSRSPVRELASVDDTARPVSHIARDGMQVGFRQFVTGDVGEQTLALLASFFEVSTLVSDLVTVEAARVTNVEIVPGQKDDLLPSPSYDCEPTYDRLRIEPQRTQSRSSYVTVTAARTN